MANNMTLFALSHPARAMHRVAGFDHELCLGNNFCVNVADFETVVRILVLGLRRRQPICTTNLD